MKALSIRQPWAWLIANGYKDIENRVWNTSFRGPFLIHAGATMSVADYNACVIFCEAISHRIVKPDCETWFPKFEQLKASLGGVVGAAEITDCVVASDSPWFTGDFGFVIQNASPIPFERVKGALGFFNINQPSSKS